jgi:hypothetical protein
MLRFVSFAGLSLFSLLMFQSPNLEAQGTVDPPAQKLENVEINGKRESESIVIRDPYACPPGQSCVPGDQFSAYPDYTMGGGRTLRFHSKPPKDNNSSLSCSKTNPKSGNPVIIATGEKFVSETDFQHPVENSLGLSRTYRSAGSGAKLFGPKWHSTLDYPKLEFGGCASGSAYGFYGGCYPDFVKVSLPSGEGYTFKRYGASPIFYPEFMTSPENSMGHLQIFGAVATI